MNNYDDFMESYYFFPNGNSMMPNMNMYPSAVNGNMTMNNQNISLDTPDEGYLKGNMFKNTYTPYKNYNYDRLTPSDEKSRLLFEIGKYAFAAHDLNLYLDLNSNDNSMLALFNDYRNKTNELINEYESKFGPLTIASDDDTTIPFEWANKNFPWDLGGRNNV